MHVAHLIWSFSIGGIETMLVDIVNEQVKSCKVQVYVINECYDINLLDKIDKKVKVTLLNRKPGSKNIWPIIKLNSKLILFHPDVIHCHVANLAPIIKVPFKKVLTIHNTHSNSVYYKHYRKLFCISQAVQKYTAEQGFPNGIVVYNGIHTEDIAVKNCVSTIPLKKLKMVCVGRLYHDKGQKLIVEAFDDLVNNRRITNISIDLIGDGKDRILLEDLTKRYKLMDYIHFLGEKSRAWFYPKLQEYDLFILSSISEGFGLTLAEACAAKLPVLTCDLPGPMEVIGNGKYGKSFKSGDSKALADEIEHVLKTNVDRNVIEEAYSFVKSNFDVKSTAKQYLLQYERL